MVILTRLGTVLTLTPFVTMVILTVNVLTLTRLVTVLILTQSVTGVTNSVTVVVSLAESEGAA